MDVLQFPYFTKTHQNIDLNKLRINNSSRNI